MDSGAIAVYAGPSLVGSPFAGLLRGKIHPPLRAGDLTEVAHTLSRGSRLLILDGEFGQSQAVTPTKSARSATPVSVSAATPAWVRSGQWSAPRSEWLDSGTSTPTMPPDASSPTTKSP